MIASDDALKRGLSAIFHTRYNLDQWKKKSGFFWIPTMGAQKIIKWGKLLVGFNGYNGLGT